MKIVFMALFIEDCLAWLDDHPDVNGIIEKDIFSGRYNILDAG
jgi:hypothetical protein